MAQPLAGVRIADFSHIIAGPLATQFLRLLGAEVIKVEPPSGDLLRFYTPHKKLRGMAEPFIAANAGKKSVVLDLKTLEGKQAAKKIVESCDIFIENFRPGVAVKLGVGYEELTALSPELIYCSVSGYGQSGPMKNFPAIDQIIQSVSGLMSLSGNEGDAFMRIGFPIVDTYCALLSAFAILSAYTQRERDPARRGQQIDVAMLDATMVMMSSVIGPMMISNREPVRSGNRGFSRAPTADTFITASGAITIGAVQQDQYVNLCKAMERQDLLGDERFETPELRIENDGALQAELSATFLAKPALEWEAVLNAARVPAGVVRNIRESLALEQLEQRDLFLEIDVPNDYVKQTSILNAGFKFAHDGPGHHQSPPTLGEHTKEVLADLGL